MAVPPLSAGSVQSRSIRLLPLAVAVRPVGAPGTVGAAASSVVALAVLEAAPVPAELMAETR